MTKQSEIERLLEILSHGSELAIDEYGRRATHPKGVWLLLAEAVSTIDDSPDRELTWLKSGTRSRGWAATGLTRQEAHATEAVRILTSMHPSDGEVIRLPATERPDHERALTVMGWFRYLAKARQPKPLEKAAVALIRGKDSHVVHQLYSPGRKMHRQTHAEVKTRTCGYILAGLREAYGIVPGPNLTWMVSPSVSASQGGIAGELMGSNSAGSAANLHSCAP